MRKPSEGTRLASTRIRKPRKRPTEKHRETEALRALLDHFLLLRDEARAEHDWLGRAQTKLRTRIEDRKHRSEQVAGVKLLRVLISHRAHAEQLVAAYGQWIRDLEERLPRSESSNGSRP